MKIRKKKKIRKETKEQAGAELGQAQPQLGFGCRLARIASDQE